MKKKLLTLLITGLLTAGMLVPAYAAESTIELKAGTTITSKGNPGAEGILENYAVFSRDEGGSFAVKKGDSMRVAMDAVYKVKGEYSIDSSTELDEDVDCKIPGSLRDRLNAIAKRDGTSAKGVLQEAVTKYCEEKEKD